MSVEFLGLRTIVYPAPDLEAAKRWWTSVLNIEPYFDQPFYVGYSVAGYELALDPKSDLATGPITYWGVEDVEATEESLLSTGATSHSGAKEVGGGIKVAVVRTPDGNLVGLIHNPHFKAE
ncbi:VOC family protein [Amycolatopsis azurea]|uniref:Glyoxalase/bleomycin resistance/extradiol dioxygenase family protein n=1 Tax=Amycolatopsis azurea DSM 43854 TaxID=1238180 RepID=A0ABX3J3Z6_9PSEU|nr:glyoxalase/bleomycin resistance/extradiol dioxygenase family protein [Amycolatopsis azurea]OOC01118.1 glyoxalase/bleomycin resistance/extradiol dioxygenase family protein [Amycolatopsis azurea DSM 43854]